MKKKTHEEFVKEVYELVGDEYSVLENYINSSTNILFRHNICKYEWNISPNNFLRGYRCPKCSNHIPYTLETLRDKIYELVGNEYEIWGEYKNVKSKINIRHNICGYEWLVNANDFLRGSRCPKCAKCLPYTTESFKEKVKELVNDEYEVLGEYQGSHIDILIKHNLCGRIWLIKPYKILQGVGCSKCAGVLPYTTETFKQKIYELVNNEYTILGEYISCKYKILIRHNICKHEWLVSSRDFLSGSRCPKCNESKGERKIRNILDNKNIIYKPQYIFNDLLSDKGYSLRFDFGILDNYYNLKFLIEFDHKQHYEWIEGWMTREKFEKTQYHDQLKNNYCEKNNISLLRIPYWDFDNIEDILTDYLINS